MSRVSTTEAVVIATTALRVPLPNHPPDTVVALVEAGGRRRLVSLAVDPDRRPKPGETVDIGIEG